MNQNDQAALRALANRITAALFARYALALGTLYIFAWGTAVLVLRMWLSMDRLELSYGGAGLAVALIAAYAIARHRTPAPGRLRAAIDREAMAGGLIMAADQADLGDWRARLPAADSPRVRFAARRPMVMLLAALAFVGGAFALPDSLTAVVRPAAPLDVREQAEQLAEQIEVLEQEKVLDDQAADALAQRLEQIADQAAGDDPAATWQRLDYLKDQLTKAADEATEQALRESQKLAELAAAAQASEQARQSPDAQTSPAELAQQMKDFGKLAEQALGESQTLRELTDEQAAEAARRMGELSDEALAELAKMDAQAAEAMQQVAEKLREIDADSLAHVDAAGKVTVFDPDDKTTFKDLRGKGKLSETHAVRMTSRAVFTLEPAVMLTVDLSAMGSGERIIALDGELEDLAVYELDAAARPTRDTLEHGGEEVVFTLAPDGTVKRYLHHPAQSEASAACQGGGEVFRTMSKNAQAAQQRLQQRVQRMVQQGLADPQQLAEAIEAAKQHGPPGAGGVQRGRADAPMTWKDPTADEGVAFDDQTLPPARLEALKQARRVGVSVGAPQLADGDTAARPGALRDAGVEGGSAARHTVLPRHRAAIEEYCQNE